MNATRRKSMMAVAEKMRELIEEPEQIGQEEQEAFDNLPDSLQDSERGQTMEEAASELEEIRDEIESLAERLEELEQR